jgi:glucan biosynthesis protein C
MRAGRAIVWIYRGDTPIPPPELKLVMRFVQATDAWCAIVAILGFGAKHLNKGGPALRYLTLGVFPFYLVHQTLIVVMAHHLAKLGLPQSAGGRDPDRPDLRRLFRHLRDRSAHPGVRILFGLRGQPPSRPAALRPSHRPGCRR